MHDMCVCMFVCVMAFVVTRGVLGKKRLDLAGALLAGLFRQLFRKLTQNVRKYLQLCLDKSTQFVVGTAIKSQVGLSHILGINRKEPHDTVALFPAVHGDWKRITCASRTRRTLNVCALCTIRGQYHSLNIIVHRRRDRLRGLYSVAAFRSSIVIPLSRHRRHLCYHSSRAPTLHRAAL